MAFRDPTRPADRNVLRRMTDLLRHRGPDSDGFHVAPGVGLGFRRLGIVDLVTGDQPIGNEDGSVVVVCNGEIYNYAALRERLVAAGHRFATASDVEVIVHLYEDLGDEFVRELRGMFALALWDSRRRRLVLARDRLGIKPLHYSVTHDALVFGSEQKAILGSGAVAPDPDLAALRQVLTVGRVVTPRTLFAGIRTVPPGYVLAWSDGVANLRQYWDVTFPSRHDYDTRTSPNEWADGLRDKLTEAVRTHLQSDVPIGAWLSGGIDSSSVVALMSRMVPGPIQTFTMRNVEPRFDELAGRRALDDFPAYHLAGHRIPCGPDDFASLPTAVWHTEGSVLGTTAIGQLLIARASSALVKVVLCGEGSDEILGGYSWYPTLPLLAPVFMLPRAVRRGLSRVPAIRRRWPGAAGAIAGPRAMNFARYSRSITHLPGQNAPEALLAPDVLAAMRAFDEPLDAMVPTPPGFDTWHPFARMQYFDIKHRLGDGVVLGLDRASMAHSVEARVPFLDHELVEFCARIPPRVKMRWRTEKHVLRRAMADILPPEIATRPKVPMYVPVDQWLRGPLPAFARDMVSDASVRDYGYFAPDKVAAMLDRHREGQANYGHALAAVLAIQLWDRLFRRSRLDQAP